MPEKFTIARDSERYGSQSHKFPEKIVVEGTKVQALMLANYLSNYYPGCDLLYMVEGCTEIEHYSVVL